MYIETSSPRTKWDTARLVSPKYYGKASCKLEFWYHMKGRDIGRLNVYIRSFFSIYNKSEALWWSLSGNQDNAWYQARIPTFSQPFEFEVLCKSMNRLFSLLAMILIMF